MSRVFTRDFLRNELDLPGGKATVRDIIYDTGRWSTYHELTFKFEDKLYQTTYSKGATEYQEEEPWENDKEVKCKEVEPYEVVTIEYRVVPGDCK